MEEGWDWGVEEIIEEGGMGWYNHYIAEKNRAYGLGGNFFLVNFFWLFSSASFNNISFFSFDFGINREIKSSIL